MRRFLYHLGQAFKALVTTTGEKAHADALGAITALEEQLDKAFVALDREHDRLTVEIAKQTARKIALRTKAAQAQRIRDYVTGIKNGSAPTA